MAKTPPQIVDLDTPGKRDRANTVFGLGSSLTYRPLSHPACVEASIWAGIDGGPALSPHLHDEAQLTVVQSGCRWFAVGSRQLRIDAGQFVVIPPRVPHQALGHSGPLTRSYDIFFNRSSELDCYPKSILTGHFSIDASSSLEDLVTSVFEEIQRKRVRRAETLFGLQFPTELLDAICEDGQSIAEIATAAKMSREGFIRKFGKNVGITPHAYRVANRVCRARLNLRLGMTPADASYEAGFADQSHMGRAFRKLYGTTPAVFRRAWQD